MFRLSKVCLCCIPIGLVLVSLLAVQPIRADNIAYMDPTGIGNMPGGFALGQNFHVNLPITVTELGVFDSGQDGIAGTLTVAIFSSDNTQEAALNFSGMTGTLIGGDRFQLLPTPVTLAPGDYSVTTVGWSPEDPNGNNNNAGAPPPPVLNDGGGAITFTGIGFAAGGNLQYLPVQPPFPADTFNAGSFVFAPEPATAILLAVGLLLLGLAPRLRRHPTL